MASSRTLLLGSLLALALGVRGGAQELAADSPFLPGASAVEGPTENAPLELRGIVGTGATRLFNLFDPSTKQSRWVGLDEPGHSFTVKAHDEASDAVTIDYAGRVLSLRLPESRITPLALAALPAPGTGNNRGRRPDNADNAVGAPSAPRELTPEEAKRLENVATEVARRRALRNTTQGGAPPAPATR
jgi:hypothetical protein